MRGNMASRRKGKPRPRFCITGPLKQHGTKVAIRKDLLEDPQLRVYMKWLQSDPHLWYLKSAFRGLDKLPKMTPVLERVGQVNRCLDELRCLLSNNKIHVRKVEALLPVEVIVSGKELVLFGGGGHQAQAFGRYALVGTNRLLPWRTHHYVGLFAGDDQGGEQSLRLGNQFLEVRKDRLKNSVQIGRGTVKASIPFCCRSGSRGLMGIGGQVKRGFLQRYLHSRHLLSTKMGSAGSGDCNGQGRQISSEALYGRRNRLVGSPSEVIQRHRRRNPPALKQLRFQPLPDSFSRAALGQHHPEKRREHCDVKAHSYSALSNNLGARKRRWRVGDDTGVDVQRARHPLNKLRRSALLKSFYKRWVCHSIEFLYGEDELVVFGLVRNGHGGSPLLPRRRGGCRHGVCQRRFVA
mmetsp:Transcript_9049/g.14830  ORF Transcript_9049/g.14830 Transcript_9049/m.14830 type:complete len:408 (-) Transcript_9049:2803-4026(-)